MSGDNAQEAIQAFRALSALTKDADTGTLTLTGLQRLMSEVDALGVDAIEAVLEQMFQLMDADGDGNVIHWLLLLSHMAPSRPIDLRACAPRRLQKRSLLQPRKTNRSCYCLPKTRSSSASRGTPTRPMTSKGPDLAQCHLRTGRTGH